MYWFWYLNLQQGTISFFFQKTQLEKSESGEKEAKRIEELYENFQKEQLRNKYLQDEVNLDFL